VLRASNTCSFCFRLGPAVGHRVDALRSPRRTFFSGAVFVGGWHCFTRFLPFRGAISEGGESLYSNPTGSAVSQNGIRFFLP